MSLFDRLQPLVSKTLSFHVKNAPGVVIGVYMVDYALELLSGLYPGRDSYTLNAICETRVCLADPIQVLTGCTFGNKYLRLNAVDYGRYALILYNRDTAVGYRVYVDIQKIDGGKYPQLFAFFNKSRDYKSASRSALGEETIREFYCAQRSIFSYSKVKINISAKDAVEPAAICSTCGESFLTSAPSISESPVCEYCSRLASKDSVPFEITE